MTFSSTAFAANMMKRFEDRALDALRPLSLDTSVLKHAEGACLISFGNTKVLCTASVEERVPPFLKGKKEGWITAEYGMLPRATSTRCDREATRGRQTGRTQEIQRLIGRSLRAVADMKALGERQIKIDCDVLQADGGTRTAAITGSYVALFNACVFLMKQRCITRFPLCDQVAAISCGLLGGHALLDLDFAEDSSAAVDANFVLTKKGLLVETQACAEKKPFTESQFLSLLKLAQKGTAELFKAQAQAVRDKSYLDAF